MKKFNALQLLLGCTLFLGFYACAPKYGAHFSNQENFYKPQAQVITPEIAAEVQEVLSGQHTAGTRMAPDQLVVSREKIISVEPSTSIQKLVEKHKSRVEKIENSSLESHALKKVIKKEKQRAKKEIKKEVKKEIADIKATSQDDDYILMMILAVLIPPLAVGLTYGISDKFWISLLLTLLFYIPGMIYALIVVHDYYR